MDFKTTAHVCAVITTSQDQRLDNLAAIADKIMKNNISENLCKV